MHYTMRSVRTTMVMDLFNVTNSADLGCSDERVGELQAAACHLLGRLGLGIGAMQAVLRNGEDLDAGEPTGV